MPRRGRQRTRERGFFSCTEGISFASQVYGGENPPNQFPRQPEEWFLEIIIRLGRNFEVLDVLLSVESYGTGLHLPLL